MEPLKNEAATDAAKKDEIDTPHLRERLAATAEQWASKPLIGNENKYGPDLEPILRYFPREHPDIGFDWCAAFVYHCCMESGLELPVRYAAPVSRNFAWVEAWMEWAELYGFYHKSGESGFVPERGDLIVFDDLLGNGANDHIGVVIRAEGDRLITAEGNYRNRSGIFDRTGVAINGYIRIADAYEVR
ncbi:hypothetical protein CDO73_01690 [Saccharibacillus sp. O23]|uniref:CHAP domain-containing protein n=1 Tax=Saccharibacillus sp. O23 TaxID=2009338 RepID=UPI000B4DFECD|nr:CHAP domain-containing protein [Saccharibacillus sp. O23]OWR32347.1 hypothetical protein CDO73_01690 [Saccharibacillus sp. O23]